MKWKKQEAKQDVQHASLHEGKISVHEHTHVFTHLHLCVYMNHYFRKTTRDNCYGGCPLRVTDGCLEAGIGNTDHVHWIICF